MQNRLKLEDVQERVKDSKIFLFDFDGTLVNLDKLNVDSFSMVFKEMFNLDFTREDFMKYISGRGSKNGLTEYLGINGIEKYSSEEVNSLFYKHKNRLIEERLEKEIYLLPGITKFLEYLNSFGKRNIVVTSSRKEHVENMLSHFGIYKYFEKVYDRFSVVRGKPSPDAFLQAIEYSKSTVKECIAFEDSFFGLQSAKGAGLFTIGVLNDGWNEDFVYQLSDFVIEDYTQLITPS